MKNLSTASTTVPPQLCTRCGEPVRYPDGVHTRKHKLIHIACVRGNQSKV